MPIVTRTPTAEVPAQPAPIQVEKATIRDIVVDHAVSPVESMVAYLDGMPWTVDYYGQLLGEHSNLKELDPGMNAAWQQYQKVKGLELRVGTSLSTGYDSENGITTVTGAAIIVHVVPNVNDYFIAEAGSRELGLFRIKNVERKTFNRDSVYQIDYDLVGYVRDNKDLASNIETKVVRTYYFSKDRLVEGLAPILREEEYNEAMDLSKAYKDLVIRYFRLFFNRGRMLLLVPGQDSVVYDFWVPDFMSKIMDSFEAPEVRELKQVSPDNDRYISQGQLWRVLTDRCYEDLTRVHQKYTLAPRQYFNNSSWLRSTAYWAVNNYIYPLVESDETKQTGVNREPYDLTHELLNGDALMETEPWLTKNRYVTALGEVPLIKSVLIDDFYVLSQDFYTGGTNLSVLEILVRDYLKNQTLDRKMLTALVNGYPDWPALEKFYYGPLLLLLLKEATVGFYA